jgi:glycerate 2-kinase
MRGDSAAQSLIMDRVSAPSCLNAILTPRCRQSQISIQERSSLIGHRFANRLSQDAEAIFAEALRESSVEQAFRAKLQQKTYPYAFTLRGAPDEPLASIDLAGYSRVLFIAAGKGAASMLAGLLHGLRLPPGCDIRGILVSPERPPHLAAGIAYFAGGHPLPTHQSFAAAQAIIGLLREGAAQPTKTQTFCFFLISGGASAMLELPLDPACSLEDTIAFHQALVHSGASIAQINCVRKHFSAVKGGRLGQLAATIPNLTILISDVPAGELDSLASGPTLPDRSSVADCREILARFALLPHFPTSVRRFFDSTALPETPKPGSFPTRVITLLSADDLAQAARRKAESLGFFTVVDNSCDDQDYRPAAQHLLTRLRQLRREHPRVCLISAGELTVQVTPSAHPHRQAVGGRNQHFVLHAATLLEPSDRPAVIFSAGSDGIDGNSPFAGALLDFDQLQAVSATAAAEALAHFDSSTLLASLGATIQTGPTGNNLRDLRLLLTDSSLTSIAPSNPSTPHKMHHFKLIP